MAASGMRAAGSESKGSMAFSKRQHMLRNTLNLSVLVIGSAHCQCFFLRVG